MHLELSDEFRSFTDSVSRYLSDHTDRSIASLLPGLANLGIFQLAVPESVGGIGAGGSEIMTIMRVLGRSVAAEPIINHVFLPAWLLCQSQSQRARDLLAEIAQGQIPLALAHDEPNGRHPIRKIATTAVPDATGYRLCGSKCCVIGGDIAQLLLVSATLENGDIGIFLVDGGIPGLAVIPLRPHGHSAMAHVRLDSVAVPPDSLLLRAAPSTGFFPRFDDHARFLLAAEAIGIMDKLIDSTIEHLQTRVQFGRPLSQFQALQHRIVDMVVQRSRAEALAIQAALCASEETFSRASLYAKYYANEAGKFIGRQAIQLHGGMGLTKELEVGRLYKRLLAISCLYGDSDYILDVLVS